MISVANDLLNNSLGLFEQMEKAKHEHRRVLTLRTSSCIFISSLHMHLFKCTPPRLLPHPISAVDTSVASSQRRPCSLIARAALHTVTALKKVARNSLSAPFLAIGADAVASRLIFTP